MSKSNTTSEIKSSELFDNYLEAKKALTDRLKTVLKIMGQCQMLDVKPAEATNSVLQKVSTVASHQWQYNSGHETIYCQHGYMCGHSLSMCTVKVPVKYLDMSDDELYQINRDAAIAALEKKKADLEYKLAESSKPMLDKMDKINAKIEALKKGEAR